MEKQKLPVHQEAAVVVIVVAAEAVVEAEVAVVTVAVEVATEVAVEVEESVEADPELLLQLAKVRLKSTVPREVAREIASEASPERMLTPWIVKTVLERPTVVIAKEAEAVVATDVPEMLTTRRPRPLLVRRRPRSQSARDAQSPLSRKRKKKLASPSTITLQPSRPSLLDSMPLLMPVAKRRRSPKRLRVVMVTNSVSLPSTRN